MKPVKLHEHNDLSDFLAVTLTAPGAILAGASGDADGRPAELAPHRRGKGINP